MTFSHALFLFYFLPMALLLHRWSTRMGSGAGYNTLSKITIFVLTLVFYGVKQPWWLVPFFISICFDFFWAKKIFESQNEKHRKILCCLSVFQNLALLSVFKYWNFFVSNLGYAFPKILSLIPLVSTSADSAFLPAGISFYTFESLSFVLDVYRKEVAPPKTRSEFFAFIAMFPRFVAGPIVRYKDMVGQFKNYAGMNIEAGVSIFVVGLFYKCVFADSFQIFVPYAYDSILGKDSFACWLGVFAFTLQIYYDFWGYSLMAVGLGWALGFKFGANFDTPYLASSLTDHWRRWHISLSTWFRDYVYRPLGGSRSGELITCRNVLGVMFLSGLWHGASWTCILWGLWHGLWLCIERVSPTLPFPKIIKQIFTFVLVMVSFVFFRSTSVTEALNILQLMFSPQIMHFSPNFGAIQGHPLASGLCFVGILHCFIFEAKLNPLRLMKEEAPGLVMKVFLACVFIISVLLMLSQNPVPFIYYQF